MNINKKTNLFVVGTIKAATTSIYHYLKQSEDIFFPEIKELHFFSDVRSLIDEKTKFNPHRKQHSRVINDFEEYNILYPFDKKYKYYGDCSPTYLSDINAPLRIKNYNPDSWIIVLIRNPIERLISHYQMNVNRGIEKDSFRLAVSKDYKNENQQLFIDNKYVELGMYGIQLKRYFSCFERERVYIIKFEDLKENTETEVNKLMLSLNLPPLNREVFSMKHNSYEKPRFNFVNRLRRKQYLKSLIRNTHIKELLKSFLYIRKKENLVIEKSDLLFIQNIYKKDQELLESLIGFKYF